MSVAAILPCYRVAEQIIPLLEKIGEEVDHIIIVDDACPQKTGEKVKAECKDKRITVLVHEQNKGVGAAVKTGYQKALELGVEILVKIDGDGQMDPAFIASIIAPIQKGEADYTKGNRFYQPEDLRQMPTHRLFGNAALSFLTKLSSGYWQIFDPANGYTAIHAKVAARLPLNKISDRYFFETDMLFRLNTLRAVVVDVPMKAFYGEEDSSLKIRDIAWEFLTKSLRNIWRRIAYNYFIRGFSLASLELFFGLILLIFGLWMGMEIVLESDPNDQPATAGTIMLCALPTIVGFQLLLSFIGYDMLSQPDRPLHPALCDSENLSYKQVHEGKKEID